LWGRVYENPCTRVGRRAVSDQAAAARGAQKDRPYAVLIFTQAFLGGAAVL